MCWGTDMTTVLWCGLVAPLLVGAALVSTVLVLVVAVLVLRTFWPRA